MVILKIGGGSVQTQFVVIVLLKLTEQQNLIVESNTQ